PLGATLIHHGSRGLAWIPNATAASVEQAYEAFAGGTWYLLVLCAVASAVALRGGIRAYIRCRRGIEVWRYAMVFSWLLVPVVAASGTCSTDRSRATPRSCYRGTRGPRGGTTRRAIHRMGTSRRSCPLPRVSRRVRSARSRHGRARRGCC